jgi:Zn-dependent protease with chaperone function
VRIRFRAVIVAVTTLLLAPSEPRAQAAAAASEEFQKAITAELEAIDPEAARLFTQANDARAREDHATAVSLYARVYDRVPSFVHALRRQCSEELAQGHRATALALCRRAVGQEESGDNLAALARALVTATAEEPVRPGELEEAARLAARAANLAPEHFYIHVIVCQVAVEKNDLALLRRGVGQLEARFPEEGGTAFYQMILAASEGRHDEAEGHLQRARDRGALSEEQYGSMLKSLGDSRPLLSKITPWVLPVGGTWIGALLVLLAAGWILSRVALRAAQKPPSGAEGAVTGFDASLRRLYQAVLWLSCGYYYLSIPILILLVLAAGGGVIFAFFWVGQIPIKLVIVVGFLTLYTLWAIVRSLFVRGTDEDPGARLDLDRHSSLRALLDEVAGRVGTRPVDNVYMTPGTEMAVMERGGSLLARARGRAERCLILGAGVLDGLRLGPLKAILAHEYGHFSNRDTAGGGFALTVRRSLLTMGQGIARGGAAAWYNPAWLFVNGFYRVFLRISQGASRLQEVMADRWAALMYGSRAFEDGLRHVIARSIRFDAHALTALNEVVEAKRPLANLYAYSPAKPPAEGDVEKAIAAALEAPPSPYDSHPSFAERIARIRAMDVAGEGASSQDARDAWSLFPEREAVERAMTAVIRRNVQLAHGVEIAADAAVPT